MEGKRIGSHYSGLNNGFYFEDERNLMYSYASHLIHPMVLRPYLSKTYSTYTHYEFWDNKLISVSENFNVNIGNPSLQLAVQYLNEESKKMGNVTPIEVDENGKLLKEIKWKKNGISFTIVESPHVLGIKYTPIK